VKVKVSVLEDLGIRLLWFDSLGAKSASIAIETSEGVVVIDPGASMMQPSYPLPPGEKARLRREALRTIEEWVSRASAVVITHYHYDHHYRPSHEDISRPDALFGKLLILKNPNKYINESQWKRARLFLSELLELVGDSLENHLAPPQEDEFEDPVERLSSALSRDYGDYQKRRQEILAKGRRWFEKLATNLWSRQPWVKEIELRDGTKVVWGDGRRFEFGDTTLEILEPWFHGVEYDRTGWVTPIVIRSSNRVVFYSSDLMGPEIEDYAEYVVKLEPDAVILDGPPTYLFPYMLNRINLQRAVENAVAIVKSRPELVIYDHHLQREKRWRERVAEVFAEAQKSGVKVITAAEYLGSRPLIDELGEKEP